MRVLLLLFLLSLPGSAWARDALSASNEGAFAMSVAPSTQVALSAGWNGLSAARSQEGRMFIASLTWRSLLVEGGLGGSLFQSGRFSGWWAASAFASPIGGWSGGFRGIAGVSALFVSDSWILRPALAASVGAALSGEGVGMLAPADASVLLAWRGSSFLPFLKLSAGVDALAGSRWQARGDAALGVVFPW